MKKAFLSIVFALGAFAIPSPGETLLTLTPGNPSPAINSSFDVFVDITGALDAPHDISGNTFSGFGFDVNVGNAGILQYDGYRLGSLFGFDFSGFGSDVAGGSTDPGGIDETDFNLAVLHFTVVGIGDSSLQIVGANDPADNLGLSWTDISDPGGSIDASIDIQTVSPEPSTWILTAGALIGAMCIARSSRRVRKAAGGSELPGR
jgi:hypothetical protein